MPRRVTAADPASTSLKTLAVLELLAPLKEGLGLNEITRRLESSRGSVLRILGALHQKRVIAQDPISKRYHLTLRLLELGTQVLERVDLQEVARPHLRRLSQLSGETTQLGILDGWDVVQIAKCEPANPVHLQGEVGRRVPSHCTSLGKALLASLTDTQLRHYLATYPLTQQTPQTVTSPVTLEQHLSEVRAQGYAVDLEEHRPGICCVGASIRAHLGEVVAAISVGGPAFRMYPGSIPTLARLVLDAAEAISVELGVPSRSSA
jgi:IclR family transcriptional regulator, KDG regulon repressor